MHASSPIHIVLLLID